MGAFDVVWRNSLEARDDEAMFWFMSLLQLHRGCANQPVETPETGINLLLVRGVNRCGAWGYEIAFEPRGLAALRLCRRVERRDLVDTVAVQSCHRRIVHMSSKMKRSCDWAQRRLSLIWFTLVEYRAWQNRDSDNGVSKFIGSK